MKHLNLFVLSLLTLSINTFAEEVTKKESAKDHQKQEHKEKRKKAFPVERTVLKRMRQMKEDFEREMEAMFQMHERMCDDFFAEDAKFAGQDFHGIRKIDVSKESDKDGSEWIVLNVHFPDSQMKYSDIKIKAKGNNLEGFVEYNDHKLKFFVVHGREFGTSFEYKHESEEGSKEGQKEQKYTKVVAALSTQMSSIPQVSNLEKTKASIQDGKLIIRLPSANSKQDWATINVEKTAIENDQNNSKENLK